MKNNITLKKDGKMKIKLIVVGMAFLGLLSIARSQTLVTNVTAAPLWTDTGIALTNGEWVNINASGFWAWGTGDLPNSDGQLELVNEWVANGLVGSLVAFVGSDPNRGTQWEGGVFQTNRYLEIGTARQFMSSTNGELWLGINDDAFSGTTGDNSGSNYVTVSTGFSCCDNYSNMTLSVAQVTSNAFSFYISNGIPNTICSVYDSADLTHWTLLDSLILDTNGSSLHAHDCAPPSADSGLTNGYFLNNTGVPYRFYKVSNGQFWSQAIGFERITVGGPITNNIGLGTNSPGLNGLIADQLIAPSNTLNGLLKPMIDGSTLPNGSQISKWNGSGYDTYTFSSGSWSPNGLATLLPGEGAFLYVTNTTTVTFAGLVPQGDLTNYPIAPNGHDTLISSMVPQAGGVSSKLKYAPVSGDSILSWTTSGFYSTTYVGTNGTGFTYPNDWLDQNNNPTNEPTIIVGESFFIQTGGATNTQYWVRKFPGCCDQ